MHNPSSARACGIDFGTSNSTVGWWRPDAEPLLALEGDQQTLPSVVFFNVEERRPVFGRLALSEYLEGYEGRLMRSLKSLLGSKLLKSETTVLGSAMPFKDILGLFLNTLKQRAEGQAGRSFDEVVLGRPVFFVDDDPQADKEAADTLAAAARKIGFKDVSFQYEPIAAAFDYESRIEREERVLIVDIGGGTSDFSLVRLAPERRQIDDRRAVLQQVEKAHCVHGRGVAGQKQGRGIHQVVPDADLVAGIGTNTRLTFPQGVHGHHGYGIDEDIHRPRTIEVIIHGLDCLVGRHAVKILERTDGSFDLARSRNRGRDVGGHLHLGRLRRKRCRNAGC